MNVIFDTIHAQINAERIDSNKARYGIAAGSEAHHAMTTYDTEILGQFCDQTGLTGDKLVKWLIGAVEAFNNRPDPGKVWW